MGADAARPVLRSLAVSSRVVLALTLVLGAVAAGCNSPTLPLPPPSVSALEYTNDQVTVEGNAIAGSLVFAYNQTAGSGAIYQAEDDGHFFMVIEGKPRDIIAIWQEDGPDISPTIQKVVPEPTP
jgi:hypothetical protein